MGPIQFPSGKEIGCFLVAVFLSGALLASLIWWIFA